MDIKEIELFDLYGDGTLVMKTNVDEPSDDLRYTWYVKYDGELIYKGQYQRNPYTAIRMEFLGEYTVKAFVRDKDGNKITQETVFLATKKTSPQLLEAKKKEIKAAPVVERVSGKFWRFSSKEEWPQNAMYAWYIYRQDVAEPVFRGSYATESDLIYSFDDPGVYCGKLFVKIGDTKISLKTDMVSVEF